MKHIKLLLLVSIALCACASEEEAPKAKSVESVSVNPSALTLPAGETHLIEAIVLPEDAENTAVIWEISDEKIITGTFSGPSSIGIEAKLSGQSTVTAITEDGGKIATCVVTVPAVPVTAISLNKNKYEFTEGKQKEGALCVNFSPRNASNLNLTVTTSDPSVVSIAGSDKTVVNLTPDMCQVEYFENGELQAVYVPINLGVAGKATITIVAEDGGYQAQCTIEIKKSVSFG